MNLAFTQEQDLLRDTLADLFAAESSSERIRRAEEAGFDPELWRRLAETGAFGIRVPEAKGGSALGVLEATILLYEAGRRLATGPVAESVVACRLLSEFGPPQLLAAALSGEAVVSLALRPLADGDDLVLAGGTHATAAVARRGSEIVLVRRPPAATQARNLGAPGLGRWPGGEGREVEVLATGERATVAFAAALEEWKLLTASYVTGMGREALQIAAAYATERIQFDRPIGTFQAVAHPLADAVADVEAARLLVHEALWAIDRGRPEAAALVSMAFAWACTSATGAARRGVQTHGGYGLSLEYDPQLYYRRVKAVPLLAGDPNDELLRAADRLWNGERVSLPDVGEVPFDFELGEQAEIFRAEVRRFFDENLTDELRAHAHFSWGGHDAAFNRKLAAAGLAFPSWPREYGGQERGVYEQMALEEEFFRAGWTRHALGTTRMVGATLMQYATDELKQEVLPRIVSGDAVTSLGYTEPASGSDVAAAQTRAVREGDDWVINGQKMFTSGADVAQYVFLLTRTDPEAKKHRGLTMFLVPLDAPGIEIQAVHTVGDERTNITYYADVRVPDRYRIGDVNGGWGVLSYALELEHGGSYPDHHVDLIDGAARWARAARRGGRPAIEDARVKERLARAATHFEAARVLARQSMFVAAEGLPARGQGPMSKLFQTEILVEDAQDLLDLAAPESLFARGDPGAVSEGEFESCYRFCPAATIYAGTSEIMRSIIAQVALGMPRSRS
ncbi:MAG: acyl-CoA dehydrogenase [Candidatus Binatia bacterium]|nr:acyl-CoA dehydrogenase [Candidatus Binatia bacterium]